MDFSNHHPFKKLFARVAIATLIFGSAINPGLAVQLANGKVFFDKVPRLEGSHATFNNTRVSGATYYFEISIPEEAGEPLKSIQFKQKEGLDRVDFNLRRTRASLSKRRGPEIPIESVEVSSDNSVTVTFIEAIAPGNTVIIGLRPYWNPGNGGVYLFGVTALPEGEVVHQQFLGYGRLHFYERDSFFGNRYGRYRRSRGVFGW